MDLRKEFSDSVGESWKPVLKSDFDKQYFINLCNFLANEKCNNIIIYPPIENVFSWTRYCTPGEVKVVIVGQDPYPEKGQAHGLSFSFMESGKLPESLIMIFKELQRDIPGFELPSHGDLTSWAKQGVLLLNSILTVRDGEAGSHKKKGWEEFTDVVIRYLNDNYSGIVFMLWGVPAREKGKLLDKEKHFVLECGHPAPPGGYTLFRGCKHFSKANKYLEKQRKGTIDWKLPKR